MIASAIPTKTELLHTYRQLLRHSLRAVRYAKPQQYDIRRNLREAFRDEKELANFDREKIRRTIWFLKNAERESGLETKILKSLVRVSWERWNERNRRGWTVLMKEKKMREEARR
jgi:hypothetical protein